MLIVSLKTLDLNKLTLAQSQGDGIEIRLDCLGHFSLWELANLRKNIHKPLIFTLKKSSQGGFYKGDDRSWYEIIKSVAALEPDFIDVDYTISKAYFHLLKERYPNVTWIVSYHETTEKNDLEAFLNQEDKEYIYKIVTKAKSALHALEMLCFLQKHKDKKIIGLSTGEFGFITRILAPIYGSYMNFCCLEEAEKTAEGQLSLTELKNTYHYDCLSLDTKVYALIGDPVNLSPSHITHNRFFKRNDWNAVYIKIAVKSNELQDFIAYAKKLNFQGLSVTMPLKEKIMPYIEYLDERSLHAKAVNTLDFDKGVIYGYNTDGIGAINVITKRIAIDNKNILIVGSGGAARAIAYEAKIQGANVFIFNRTEEKAQKLCHELNLMLYNEKSPPFDIIINCTPAEMPIQETMITPEALVLDIVHTRESSLFLTQAKTKSCTIIYGLEMFESQANEQFKIWNTANIQLSHF